jgi:hypothetical protein
MFVSDESFRKINNRQQAENLMYSLAKESKLRQKSIYDFFYQVRNTDVTAPFEEEYKVRRISLWREN